MLPAVARMRHRADFLAARSGIRAGRSTVAVQLTLTGGDATPRVGFVVSRAVGSAVVRNRVTRRLRHLMRDRLRALPPGSLLVVRANPAAAMRPAQVAADLDASLATALRRAAGRTQVVAP